MTTMMCWRKFGLVWAPDGTKPWARTHASVPTPVLLNSGVVRVFLTTLDDKGRGRPSWVDVDARNPMCVVGESPEPLLDLGRPGSFDDNGVMLTSVVELKPGVLALYYAGFELSTQIRYRILTGVALSYDNGTTFNRIGDCPVLERSNEELYFRGGPFVLLDEDRYRLWYVAGSSWTDLGDGKPMPVYDLRYQESADGLTWGPSGRVSMSITGADEHGFGRPWVVKRGPQDYQLFYSIRRRSLAAYRLGYAESADGVAWRRRDEHMGLNVTPGAFDSKAIMYSAVIDVAGRSYCFYNGDNFGERGFGVAVLEQ